MSTTYSAFFSSGLLAPHRIDFSALHSKGSQGWDEPPSPATPSDRGDDEEAGDTDRSVTPMPTNQPPATHTRTTSQSSTRGLRKRRSSTSLGTSALSAIKSPSRTAAGSAYAYQRRTRSGSVNAPPPPPSATLPGQPQSGSAEDALPRKGRMRSNTVGHGANARPRRPLKRSPHSVVPAPSLPPPRMPLPAVPPLPSRLAFPPADRR